MSEQASRARRQPNPVEVIEGICDDFAKAGREGSRPKLEEFLARAEAGFGEQLFCELLKLEVQQREAAGERPEQRDYLERFPQYARSIRQFLGNLPTAVGEGDTEFVTDARASQTAPELPRPFGGYELLEKLGEGGMGVVYKARQVSANRMVALKLIRAHRLPGADGGELQSLLARFRTEAEAAAQLQHDNIVTVYDVGEVDGQPYYAMRYVQGESLYHKLSDGPLEPKQAARFIEQVGRALAAAHAQGILHRDVKPHNVMVDDESGRALLTDFGLAKLSDSDQQLTATEAAMGSPPYMSPEQTVDSAMVTATSDVYGAGATLFHLITGRPPFRGANTAATLVQVQTTMPIAPRRLNPAVPRDLETITLKCLEKTPGERIPSAAHLADELTRFLEGRPIVSRPAGRLERVYLWCKRKPVAASLLGAVAVVVVMTALALVFGYQAMRADQLADLDTQFEQKIASLQLTEDDIGATEALISQMATLSPMRAQDSRSRLAAALQMAIERRMQVPRLDGAVAEELLAACSLLETYAQKEAQALAAQIQERSWRTVLSIESPFDKLKDVFDQPYRPRVAAAGLQWQPPSSAKVRAQPICLTRHPATGKIELEAVFAADWQQAGEIGLAMFADGMPDDEQGEGNSAERGILFKLQSSSQLVGRRQHASHPDAIEQNETEESSAGDPANFGERRKVADSFFTLVVIRDGVIVQTGRLPAAQVSAGELTLWARQESNRLSFQVNDHEQLVFEELFPADRRIPTKLGLLWPTGVTLTRLTARRLAPTEYGSPLEQGDLLYARSKFSGALEHYRRQSEILDDPELSQEVDFKRAQCLVELNRGAEARTLWEDLVERGGDRWKASAMISLWVLALEEDRLDDADRLFDVLSVQYSLDDLAVRIPKTTRQKIVTLAVDPVVVTSLRPHPHPVRNLQRALAIQSAAGVPFTETFSTRWMLLGAYDREGDLEAALQLARELLEQIDHSDFRHRLVLEHYVWLEARFGSPERAHAYLDRYLQLNAQGSDANNAAALLMRGRLFAFQGDWEAAGRAIDEGMKYYRWPPARVWMARGLVALRANQPEKARDCWDRGYAQNKLSSTRDSIRIVHTFMLGLLAEKVTKQELHTFIARATQSDFDSPAIRLITQGMLPKKLFEESLLHLRENPRTLGLLEDWHFFRLSYEDSLVLPYRIVAHESFTTFVLGLDRRGGRLTAEQDELIWETTGELYAAFKRREFNELNIAQAFFTWKGNVGLLGWSGLSSSLKPATRGPTAYVFGCHFVHLGKYKQAAGFFQTAWKDAPADSLLERLIGQRLAELIRTAPPEDSAHYLQTLKEVERTGRNLGAARFELAAAQVRQNDMENAVRQYAAAAVWRERTAPYDEAATAAQQELEKQLPPEKAVAAYLVERGLEPESLAWHQHAAAALARVGLPEQAAENFSLALGQRRLSNWILHSPVFTGLLESDEVCERTLPQLNRDTRIDFLIARGQYFGSRGRWKEASASYSALGETLPGSYVQFEYACLLQLVGGQETYAQLCQRLVEQFADTRDEEIAGNCASIGALSPASEIESEQLLQWANLALETHRDKYNILKAAPAYYRAGDYQKAIDLLNESLASFGEHKSNAAFILALSYHRLGQQEKAQSWREVGERELQQADSDTPQKPTRWGHGHWVTVNAWRQTAQRELETPPDDAGDEIPDASCSLPALQFGRRVWRTFHGCVRSGTVSHLWER